MNITLTDRLTARRVLSPRVDLNISRLTGTNISLNGPAQEILVLISRHTHIKYTVCEIWVWVHLLVAEAEGAIRCLNHRTLSFGRQLISTFWAGGTTPITAGVIARDFPSSPKLIHTSDNHTRWGFKLIIWISIEVSTKSTCFLTIDDKKRII